MEAPFCQYGTRGEATAAAERGQAARLDQYTAEEGALEPLWPAIPNLTILMGQQYRFVVRIATCLPVLAT